MESLPLPGRESSLHGRPSASLVTTLTELQGSEEAKPCLVKAVQGDGFQSSCVKQLVFMRKRGETEHSCVVPSNSSCNPVEQTAALESDSCSGHQVLRFI